MSCPPKLIGPGGSGVCFTCAIQQRSVDARLVGGGDPTAMVAWVNWYFDNHIDDIAWGQGLYATFDSPTGSGTNPAYTDPDGASPDDVEFGPAESPYNGLLETTLSGETCVTTASDEPEVARTQYYLPNATAYYVIASGQNLTNTTYGATCGTQFFAACGCLFPEEDCAEYPMIVDLAIPDNAYDASVLIQDYTLGIIDPGGAATMDVETAIGNAPVLQNLTGIYVASSGGFYSGGFGANWAASLSTPCHASPDDPFSGDAPP